MRVYCVWYHHDGPNGYRKILKGIYASYSEAKAKKAEHLCEVDGLSEWYSISVEEVIM